VKVTYIMVLFALSAGASAQNVPKPRQLGGYIPNSQLLEWCKSHDTADFQDCYGYIEGVRNLASNTATGLPAGPIAVPIQTPPIEPIKVVLEYLQHLDPTLLSSPASDSVYRALVAKYPYKAATP
jgi:hypothetical protein